MIRVERPNMIFCDCGVNAIRLEYDNDEESEKVDWKPSAFGPSSSLYYNEKGDINDQYKNFV